MLAYVNGQVTPVEEAKVPVLDRGFLWADGVFEVTRTFAGEPFMLDEHLHRLGLSLRYMEIDPAAVLEEAREACRDLTTQDTENIAKHGDVLLYIVVTRGVAGAYGVTFNESRMEDHPTVAVVQFPIDLVSYGPLYSSGVDLGVSLNIRHFQGAVDPRVKALRGLAAARGELHSSRLGGGASGWTVVFGDDGSIAEAKGANLALVSGEELIRPPLGTVLEGVSLGILCDIASQLGLRVREQRLTIYDFLNADEVMMTASSFQILPVAAVDGIPVGRSRETYETVLREWFKLAQLDFVAQANEFAGRAN